LPILACLVGKDGFDLFAAAVELNRRDLMQERGPWRAVLPHAIANRLAKRALQNIPRDSVSQRLVAHAPTRLLRSFSRRLGYLDGSKEAKAIVEAWLAPGGLLADPATLNELGQAIFTNVAPVAPEATLSALERVLDGAEEPTLRACNHFAPLLRSLAYAPGLFERAVSLLVRLVRLQEADGPSERAADVLTSLFLIVMSGTHAPVDMRLKVVAQLLTSGDQATRALGVSTLHAMLKTDFFSSSYSFEFGARSRDFGYEPKTAADVSNWFTAVLKCAESFALADEPIAGDLRTAIANEVRGLWHREPDQLERTCQTIATKGFWREGWVAVRETRIYDGKGLPEDLKTRLIALEDLLRPRDLVDRIRGIVIGSKVGGLDVDELEGVKENDYAGARLRAAQAAEQLGRDLVHDDTAFETLLPELVVGGGRVANLGRGVALETPDPRHAWSQIVAALTRTETTSVDLLGGFLEGLRTRDESLLDTLLDDALTNSVLVRWLPVLQTTHLNDKALSRLHHVLDNDKAPITQFYFLAYGRASDVIPPAAFRDLVVKIARKPDGTPVAIQIMSMRLHSDTTDKRPSAPEVLEAAREILSLYQLRRHDKRMLREDYELGRLVQASLPGESGKAIARRLCGDLLTGFGEHKVYAHDYGDMLEALFQVQPTEALDQFFGGDEKSQRQAVRLLHQLLGFRQAPMNSVDDETVISWCEMDPSVRFPLIASSAALFRRPKDKEPHEWTPLTKKLLRKAPDPAAVLQAIVGSLFPRGGWSGSLATKLESRLQLLAG
jgi:hypothetical protein